MFENVNSRKSIGMCILWPPYLQGHFEDFIYKKKLLTSVGCTCILILKAFYP